MFNRKNYILFILLACILSFLFLVFFTNFFDFFYNPFYLFGMFFSVIFISIFVTLYTFNKYFHWYNKKLKDKFIAAVKKSVHDTIISDYLLSDDNSIPTLLNLVSDYIIKIENENKQLKSKNFAFKENISSINEDILSFKNLMNNDIIECFNKSNNIEKFSNDYSDFTFESEEVMNSLNLSISEELKLFDDVIGKKIIIKENFDRVQKIHDKIENLFSKLKSYGDDSKKDLNKIISRLLAISKNMEKQSLNILNTYIFSQYDSVDTKDNMQMEYDKEENIRNIKEINEKIIKDVSDVKNVITFLNDKNSIIFNELKFNFQNFEYINYLINEFDSIFTFISKERQQYQSLLNNIMNRIKRIKYEYDNVKNIILSNRELKRHLEKLSDEVVNLKK